MITFSIVKDIYIRKFRRILKIQQYGAKTADQVSSFGDDSAPIKDMIAIYAKTAEVGDDIILGYLNKNQVSQPGEKRIFSLKENGTVSFSVYLKKDGTCEIGDGATDNAVRYSALKTAFDELKNNFNTFVSVYNAHVHIAAGANTTPPGIQGQVSAADITGAKIDQIKIL